MAARATYCTVSDLTPDSSGHNLVVLVHSVEVVVERKSSYEASQARTIDRSRSLRIAEVVAGDASGTVVLSLRNEQIDLATPNKALVIRNGRVDMFRGFMRLRVDKWGKIAVHPDGIESTPPAPESVLLSNNVSLCRYAFIPGSK